MYKHQEDLEIRLTRKYVGECKHLDEWETLFATFHYNTCTAQEFTSILVGVVDKDLPRETIKTALKDVFTSIGCGCDYDCCGCTSTHVRRIEFRTDYILVELHHTINN